MLRRLVKELSATTATPCGATVYCINDNNDYIKYSTLEIRTDYCSFVLDTGTRAL